MYQILSAKPFDSLSFLSVVYPEAFRSQKSDPRGMQDMYLIFIAKPIDSLILLPFGHNRFGAEKQIREGCQASNESGCPD